MHSARDVLIWFWAFVDLNITVLIEKTIQKFVFYYLPWTMRHLIVSRIKNVQVNFYKLRKIKHKRKNKILKIDKGSIRNLEILKYWILYYHTKTKWWSLCMLEPSIVATLTLHLYNSQINLFQKFAYFFYVLSKCLSSCLMQN